MCPCCSYASIKKSDDSRSPFPPPGPIQQQIDPCRRLNHDQLLFLFLKYNLEIKRGSLILHAGQKKRIEERERESIVIRGRIFLKKDDNGAKIEQVEKENLSEEDYPIRGRKHIT